MSQTWSIFSAVTFLAVQLCIGEKSCTIWSSAGPVVQRDSSFKVYCIFNLKCKGSMYSGHPPTQQPHTALNSTTMYLNVVNINKDRTYSCQCAYPVLDPCGLDIKAGYPPDTPKNISCSYKVMNDESGVVFCAWDRGRETYFRDSSVLWVRTAPRNHTDEPQLHNGFSKRNDELSVNFTVSRSVQLITVWVQAKNTLGSAQSSNISYTLSDIATPSTPVLGTPVCTSRECIIKVNQSVRTQHLEIQYTSAEQTWTSYLDQSMQVSTVQYWTISSLEPYSLYNFRVRSKFSSGLWSQWSSNISCWTEEEAPAEKLDVWYAESGLKSLRVYWKVCGIVAIVTLSDLYASLRRSAQTKGQPLTTSEKPNMSVSRGKIIGYQVRVYSPELDSVTNVSSNIRNYTVCAGCEVTLWARNSKGLSPPATITAFYTKDTSEFLQVLPVNDSVTISWRKAETAPLPDAYVVEWYPEGLKLEELKWMTLSRNDNHAVITDIKPFECYKGAVYGYYNDRSLTRTMFAGITTLESVPEAGPVVQEKVEGHTVKVMWAELPRGQRKGCITKYMIYLETESGHQQFYTVPPSETMHVIKHLSPAAYSLWMTASTAAGEGPARQKIKFYIQEETQLWLLLLCGVAFVIVVLLLCLCQCSSVKEKLWVYFQCLMLDIVPDPANSKWAKECTQEESKMNLKLQPSVTKEEEEPVLVDVEELPNQNSDISTENTNVFSQLLPQIGLRPETEPATQLYPLSTYIKSFSHDSDNSDHTQTSLDTNTTIDYISSHGMGNMEEEDEEEEEEMLDFFPSQNIFIDTLKFEGKLTLDAVKIDFCGDFFQNS